MTVYLSKNADKHLKDYLISKGYDLFVVDGEALNSNVSNPISCHPDIYFCDLKEEIYKGEVEKLGMEYPGDVLYNAARIGKYFVCSKYTDENLVKRAEEIGLEIIKVSQGYVKCNIAIIDDKHVITEDEGIYKALSCDKYDIETLLIHKGEVGLSGYKYGFIGGASGRVGDEIIFNGNLSIHSDFNKIEEFIKKCNANLKYFKEYSLEDIGSIISQ